MKKIFIGSLLMVSMLFVGCSADELPKIGPDKEVEEEVVVEVDEEVSEEAIPTDGPPAANDPAMQKICSDVASEYAMTLKYEGNGAFFITSNKTKDECADKTEILSLMKDICDRVDAVCSRDYEVFYQTSDFNFVSIFRVVETNTYYVVYFDEIVNNIYEYVQ